MSKFEAQEHITFTTSSGSTFKVEKKWIVSQSNNTTLVQDPDRILNCTLIENTQDTADNAVLAAWHTIQPDFSRSIQHRVVGVPTDGWDESVLFVYTVSTQENRLLMAQANRSDTTWYIALIDGTPYAMDQRTAGLALLTHSFKSPNTKQESFAHKKAHVLNSQKLEILINFIEDARIKYNIPGAALGIVQDGIIICTQGFGVRKLGTQEVVTPETLFMIGSTTKSLTTFMMAQLVDEGKFSWDTPVTQLMPTFELGDTETTQKLMMKHMVSANTGLPRQDLETLLNYDHATPKTRLHEMKNMKPTTGFGETFQYSNNMVAAGGFIAAHTVYPELEYGEAYDKAMQSRLFDPLHMKATGCDVHALPYPPATPHGQMLNGSFAIFADPEEKWITSFRPAGGIWSNVYDMSLYMITELNNGINAQGERVISEANLLKRRESHIKITDKWSYGLGLIIANKNDVMVIAHGGNTLGFTSEMFFLPEHNVGLVILTNARAVNTFTGAVSRKLMELLFDGKDQASEMVRIHTEQNKNMFKKELERINFHPDATWCETFLGTYVHPTLGHITINKTADGIELDARVWKGALGQKKEEDGTLLLITTDGFLPGIECLPKKDLHGNIMQLVIKSGQHTYIFEKQNITN